MKADLRSWRAMYLLLVFTGTAVRSVPPIGTAIEQAAVPSALLAAAARITPPGPPFAQSHLQQDVHQVKRQSLASNALERLARQLIGSRSADERRRVLADDAMSHLAACAAAPSTIRQDGEDATTDRQVARMVECSLAALATICGEAAADMAQSGGRRVLDVDCMRSLTSSAIQLAERAEALSGAMGQAEAVSARWSIRRLLGEQRAPTPQLDMKVADLPFDMVPLLAALPELEVAAEAGMVGRAAGGAEEGAEDEPARLEQAREEASAELERAGNEAMRRLTDQLAVETLRREVRWRRGSQSLEEGIPIPPPMGSQSAPNGIPIPSRTQGDRA